MQLSNLSDQQLLHNIKEILTANHGDVETYIVVVGELPKKIRLPFKVAVTDELIAELSAVVGDGHVTRAS